jgi:hypothetical protein
LMSITAVPDALRAQLAAHPTWCGSFRQTRGEDDDRRPAHGCDR